MNKKIVFLFLCILLISGLFVYNELASKKENSNILGKVIYEEPVVISTSSKIIDTWNNYYINGKPVTKEEFEESIKGVK